ncbi:uncharacterized protein LOC121372158 [Gigantopelta aegis]|uniref:uncharacterized protein LOC121372158 n=1 Tax=Gigantopelta aegis TaxID=1735272 RepID=UPI001B88CD09|nr:uncharacterized protein LOC121372158 [Gigantopelta aegis]
MKWSCRQLLFLFAVVIFAAHGEINKKWMKDALQSHFSQPRHHATYPKYKMRAMRFIRDEFREYGLETHLDTFNTLLNKVSGINVIGVLKGKHFNTDDDVIVGVAAHYDTMRDTSGVDDNGAAVVAMLQAAKKVASEPLRNNTVIFAAFDLEEWEDVRTVTDAACGSISCGCLNFMNTWVPNFWSSTPVVSGVMVMDTIMNFDETRQSQKLPVSSEMMRRLFPVAAKSIASDGSQGDFLTAIGRPADSRILDAFVNQFQNQGQGQYEVEKFMLSMLKGNIISPDDISRYEHFMRSDHAIFWQAGIPAIFITDTANFRGYMQNCYHKRCDTMEKVTDSMIEFAAKTSRALAATVNQMAPTLPNVNSGHQTFPEVVILFWVVVLAMLPM